MTNFEFLKTLKTAEEFLNFYDYVNFGCIQHGPDAKKVWHDVCLSEEFRGKDGCRKCKLKFWNSEVNFECQK